MPELTICICTLDRADPLAVGLEALLQNKQLASTEIIVVNNGPSEKTREVVECFAKKMPVRYIRHEKSGLGEVRNRGWQESAAEWIAYIDDDSIVYPTWLQAAIESTHKVEEKCFAIAGNVDAGVNPAPLPSWCHPKVAESAFSNINFGTIDGYLKFPHVPLGNNMIFRKSFLRQNHGFSTQLRGYDEAYVGWLGYCLGGTCFFSSQMKASHPPSAERISKRWIFNKCRDGGRGYQTTLSYLKQFSLCPPRYDFFVHLPITVVKLAVSWLFRDSKRVTASLAGLWFEVGRFENFAFGRMSGEYSTFKGK